MKLLADIALPGHHFSEVTERAAGSDAFVLMTLGFLGFLLGAFVAAAIVLWHRQAHPQPHRKLLMEMEEEEETDSPQAATTMGTDDEQRGQSWEREADWWKK